MAATFFKNSAEFRQWLHDHHEKESELWLGYYKKNSGKANYTWSETVDQALCYGWIDGIRKSIDEDRYMIRFTPRKPKSIWSAVNIKKIKELKEKGLMQAAGLAAYAKKEANRSNVYSFEQEELKLDEVYLKQIKANKQAWEYFQSLSPSYTKSTIWYVMSAKREATRQKRIQLLVDCCEKGEKLPQFKWSKKK